MAKKVCIIVAHHPFTDARIFKKEAKSLQKKGYHITMIVPRQSGRLFDIDGTPFRKQFLNKVFTYEGIKVVTYHSESTQKALSTVLSNESVWERHGFNNTLTQLAIQEDADIYHAHEYLSLFAGVGIKRQMKKKKGKDVKLIYDSHELTPDPLDPRYTKERRDLLKQRLLTMLDEVDHVITVSDSIKSWYLSHKPDLPVDVIYNSPPLAQHHKPKTYNSNGLTVGYEGNIVASQGKMEKILCISELCSKELEFEFKIIGGSRYGDSKIPTHLPHQIMLTGWIDYHALPKTMDNVDIGMVDLESVKHSLNQDYALPNKFFSYLNNGVPVVVNKCKEMEEFINRHHCGFVIDKTNATSQDFANAFLSLHQDMNKLQRMSQNARHAMERFYSWEHMENRLFAVYQSLFAT
ncbi:Glycosyltransferase involved in cell wall bisynthesis [Lentibacillus persicus]|uniref:Glycosyltransferase involved in cell wall bisynthesis n=1 Tax=Lentibacillus persicus TaxID=640948 RepID=A0A1I1YA55_9BACI|nr:glycosyltransferase [Lentibacillus persicus]SFE16309.1 Glycosyltransferase involved in cell wall bisynthesis [Lentibacillus persicus]